MRGLDVCALRILLDTGSVRATVPMLRGVWGCTLREYDPLVYRAVFEGHSADGTARNGHMSMPLYVMRPAPPDPDFAPAVEILFLGEACRHVAVLLEAFRRAGKAGLGRKREHFRVRQVRGVLPDGRQVGGPQVWSAGNAAGSSSKTLSNASGLRLAFEEPLRILRHGKLIYTPSFVDMAVAGLRRLCALSPVSVPADFQSRALDAARQLPTSGWRGHRQDLVRWSGRQKDRIEMRGVTGWLDLPGGAGLFRPLLAVLEWIHLGKGTVFGLGKLKLQTPQTGPCR